MGKGNLGTSAQPIKLYSERVVLTPRTSDPGSPATGEHWFREDLDSGTDKRGEVRWYDGSSTQSVPVFNTGTSGSDVEEVVRIQTKNGLAYVPIAATGDAAYPERRFQHGGNTLAWHDAQAVIPDSAVHQWKFDEGTGTTAADSIGSNDGTINGATWASVSDAVGGYVLDFDGTDDDVTYSTIDSVIGTEQQFSVTITANMDDLSADQTILGHTQSADTKNRVEIGTSQSGNVFTCSTFDGSNILSTSTTSADSVRQRIGVRHDGGSDTIDIFINGSEVSDGTERTSLSGTPGFRIGANAAGDNYAAARLDNPIVYNDLLSDTQFADDYNRQPWS